MIDEATIRDRLHPDSLPDLLVRLGFHDDDAVEAVAAADRVRRRRSDLAVVARSASLLAEGVGIFRPTAPDPWQDLPEGREDLALLALLASVDEVRAEHARRRIPDAISWGSLADLGQQVSVNRLTHGRFGLDTYGWMRTAWSGGLMWLGRLEFVPKPSASGWVLDTHIPASGPLTPESVDAAFAAAAPFFARHFPDCPVTAFACTSWLLDPTIADLLPASSNLVQFQRRWTLAGSGYRSDESVIYFAFNVRSDPEDPIDPRTLTARTSLQRAVVDHLVAGGHWSAWSGTAPLPDPTPTPDAPDA
ncbi:acyltransferase domain-containing protein [Pseudactinotalea suaedae]|uniref:acyltransferase domain-containing protein n=1 Tax=Pseudactinotalea suaedae TaxID=1524924 RepID=UPI0012E27957|nr:acyltransferase domain-containing protein [Pseudactinotalea suaedae]